MSDIDSILLGDNPLFGINHLAQEKARDRSFDVQGLQGIGELIQYSLDMGYKGFVVSTHPDLKNLIDIMKKETNVIEKMNFYPILPYAQGYVTMVTEKGVPGAIKEIFNKIAIGDLTKIIGHGTIGFMKKDFQGLFKTFIEIEISPLKNIQTKIVFLHDVVTDLALGMNIKEIIEIFISAVGGKHNMNPGLVTKNFPLLVSKLKEWDIPLVPIMTSFNKIGSQMNPSREECEKCLEENNVEVIAMNTLAGGYLNPNEAFEYINNLPKIKSIVVGASTKKHIADSFDIFSGKNQL